MRFFCQREFCLWYAVGVQVYITAKYLDSRLHSFLLKSTKNLSFIRSDRGLFPHSSSFISIELSRSSSNTHIILLPNPSSRIPTFPSSCLRRDRKSRLAEPTMLQQPSNT